METTLQHQAHISLNYLTSQYPEHNEKGTKASIRYKDDEWYGKHIAINLGSTVHLVINIEDWNTLNNMVQTLTQVPA